MASGRYHFKCIQVDIGDAKLSVMWSTNEVLPEMKSIEVMHSHGFYEIHLIEKGFSNMKTPDRNITLTERQILVVNPENLHVGTIPQQIEFERRTMALGLDKQSGEEGYYEYLKTILDSHSMIPVPVSEELMRSIVWVQSFRPSCIRDACIEKIKAAELIWELVETLSGFETTGKVETKGKTMFKEQEGILLDSLVNCPTPLSLAEISHDLGYSVRQVSRMIKKKYGAPYKKMRTARMIEYAKKRLVEEPDLPVKKIIESLDEKSTASFYRVFAKYVGCTPKEYRERKLHESKDDCK